MLFTRNASVRMKLLDFDYPTSYTKTRAFRVFLFNFRKFSAGAVLVEGLEAEEGWKGDTSQLWHGSAEI